MEIALSGQAKVLFWIVVLFLGVPTLGVMPLYIWWVMHKQYPKTIYAQGIVTRNGKHHAFTDIAKVTPTRVKGGYWIDFKDKARVTISPTMLANIDGLYALLSERSGRKLTA